MTTRILLLVNDLSRDELARLFTCYYMIKILGL